MKDLKITSRVQGSSLTSKPKKKRLGRDQKVMTALILKGETSQKIMKESLSYGSISTETG
jgi:hypothetical protein